MAKKPSSPASFKRAYKEDYVRPLNLPSYFQHAFSTLKILCTHWKLFGGLLIVMMVIAFLLVGVMSENTYVQFQQLLDTSTTGDLGAVAKSALLLGTAVSTGGFAGSISETQAVFTVVIFLITWLVTIYLLRHLAAKKKVTLADALFNALGPLLSTACVIIVILFDLLPIGLFVIILSAAVTTKLLTTPLYFLIFVIFSALLILLSLYLLSSSLIALIAVSAPGVYPLTALHTASELIQNRRFRFALRIAFCVFIVVLAWLVIMIPLILIDLWFKSVLTWAAGFPFISACLLFLTCATFIYVTAYFYLLYRRILDADE